jgi:hypothetical protein
MSEKILIGSANALTGENTIIELQGQELTTFLADQAEFHNSVLAKEAELKTKRDAIEAKMALLGLTKDDLVTLGLLPKEPKAEQSTPSLENGTIS